MKKQTIPYLLITLMLLQSCVVYQKIPVPLSESYDKGKVKVVNIAGEKLKFKKIIRKDSIYYGFNRKKLKNDDGVYEWADITLQLNADGVEAIYLKDKSKSTEATIILVVISPFLAYGALYLGIIIAFALGGT